MESTIVGQIVHYFLFSTFLSIQRDIQTSTALADQARVLVQYKKQAAPDQDLEYMYDLCPQIDEIWKSLFSSYSIVSETFADSPDSSLSFADSFLRLKVDVLSSPSFMTGTADAVSEMTWSSMTKELKRVSAHEMRKFALPGANIH